MAEDEEVLEEQEQNEEQDIESVKTVPSQEEVYGLAPPKYEVRPGLGEKFQAENVREIIVSTMREQLMGRQYRADQAVKWAKMIANGIRHRVQTLDMKRYKIVVQCVLIESKGAGVKCGQRCIWDPETDDFIYDLYRNDSIFCHTTVYGVYMY